MWGSIAWIVVFAAVGLLDAWMVVRAYRRRGEVDTLTGMFAIVMFAFAVKDIIDLRHISTATTYWRPVPTLEVE